jgi:hypothetical protein
MNTKRHLVEVDHDDELLFEAIADPPILIRGTALVEARCIAVTRAFYFNRPKLVFKFKVIEPELYRGQKLEMFARNSPTWKSHPPVSSKLWKIAAVALGRLPEKHDRVTKSMFLGKTFKCTVGNSGKGVFAYSVVEMISEVSE